MASALNYTDWKSASMYKKEFFAPLAVGIPGNGAQAEHFLHGLGVRTVKTLRQLPLKHLTGAFGKNGLAIHQKAHAVDNSLVVPYSEQKSISTER